MALLTLEHSKAAYWFDFAFYGVAVVGLGAALIFAAPATGGVLMALAIVGLAGWTLVEYLLHRLVLHRIEPFRSWHAAHHRRPGALIASPTLLSATLLTLLVVLPGRWLLGPWPGAALACGVLVGYLAYTVTHHALHHWRLDHAWLQHRKRAHALHHHLVEPASFGVTSGLWDRVFGTVPRPQASSR